MSLILRSAHSDQTVSSHTSERLCRAIFHLDDFVGLREEALVTWAYLFNREFESFAVVLNQFCWGGRLLKKIISITGHELD